jgi:hypothetical protein
MQDSAEFMQSGLTLAEHVETKMRSRLNELKGTIETLKWKLRSANESLRVADRDIDFLMETRQGISISM